MPSALVLGRPWSRRAIREVNTYLSRSIGRLRERFPGLRFTFSFQEFGASNLRKLDLTPLDLIDAHIWASDDLWWSFVSAHYRAAFGFFRHGVQRHAARASNIYGRHRDRCIAVLNRRMDWWRDLARDNSVPVVTTEGWVSTFYDDVDNHGGVDTWAWVKDLTEAAVRLAVEKGWSGVCSSNFCQPHFRQFWSDTQWHQRITSLIKTGAISSKEK